MLGLVDEGHRTAWHIQVLDEVYFFVFQFLFLYFRIFLITA